MTPVLHGYWRSGPSWRVRIALAWKGVAFDYRAVNLLAREERDPAYLRLNPQGRIPALEVEGAVLTQAPAILEWLEETHPERPLLPADPIARAKVRALDAVVACDITPLQNLGSGRRLAEQFGADEAQVNAWRAHFIGQGLAAFLALVERDGGDFCVGDAVTLADLHLVSQLFGARRFGVDLGPLARLVEIETRCAALPAFQAAEPDRQPDAPRPMRG